MTDGSIVYDYPVIEQCVSMMMKKADEIDDQATTLGSQVKAIMTDWVGETASAYEQRSLNLQNGLDVHRSNLLALRTRLEESAERMKQADRGGAKGIS
ncbi:WXG100 family type VII secretion target [Amycolatopsis sp. NPDC102389]|uniref:WXG100 family type VII secretion target n=1 Tax=Amycolatopsis sp. NPDC102389 TaxID=3363941 RepID=UPI00382902F2